MNAHLKIALFLKKNTTLFIIILCVFFYAPALANKKADSLRALLTKQSTDDTTKIQLLYSLSGAYKDIDLDSVAYFAKEGLQLSEKINFDKGIAFCSQELGLVYLRKDIYDSAIKYYHRALDIYEKNNEKERETQIYLCMGDIYYRQANYNSSLENYNKTIALCEKVNDLKTEGLALIDIGGIYSDQSNFMEAINYYLKGLKVFERLNDKSGISMTLINIGTIYSAMGNYKVALDYVNKSIPITKEVSNKEVIFSNLVNTGVIYGQGKDYKNALNAYYTGLSIADSMGDKSWQNVCLVNIADVYFQMGSYDTAYITYTELEKRSEEQHDITILVSSKSAIGAILIKKGKIREGIKELKEAIDIAIDKQIKQSVFNAAKDLSDAYEQLHDYPNALKYHKIYYDYRDSLYNEKKRQANSAVTI